MTNLLRTREPQLQQFVSQEPQPRPHARLVRTREPEVQQFASQEL